MRSIIQGGSGAVSSGFGSMLIDPKDFNLGAAGARHMIGLMGISFAIAGILHMCMYLQTHGIPDQVTIDTPEINVAANLPPRQQQPQAKP